MSDRIRYETPADGVARIVLARPEMGNAQDKRLLYELNDAFDRAAQDDDVRVIVLAADGADFSTGHDVRDTESMDDLASGGFEPVSCWSGFGLDGAEGYLACEAEYYVGLCWRWRNIPKPTIAAVQGRVLAGGLMLVWPCDIVIAADDAVFADPVVAMGVNGHEYFTHTWELGARKAKELLFTGDPFGAQEAKEFGMVNHVVPLAELEERVLAMAQKIAARPTMGVKLAKMAVNQSLELQGQWHAIQASFSIHQLGHSNNMQVHGMLVDPSGFDVVRDVGRTMREMQAQASGADAGDPSHAATSSTT